MKKMQWRALALAVIALAGAGLYWYMKPKPLHLTAVRFTDLPGFKHASLSKALKTFQASCKTILRQNPKSPAGSPFLPMTAADWKPACEAALAVHPITSSKAKHYFQTWFEPKAFYTEKPVQGLFTGYYMPLFRGSLEKTDTFHVPLFGTPKNLVFVNLGDFDPTLQHKRVAGRVKGHQLIPYFTRKEINQGAVDKHAPVLAWLKSPIDRLYLEIQGSGVIMLQDSTPFYIGYAAQNGAPYTAIGKVLIQRGHLTPEQASMQSIRAYLESHPEQIDEVLNHNPSFVFFTHLKHSAALGAQGIPLTPGYSLAVDRHYIPLGLPLWLNTTHPTAKGDAQKPLQRLMIAQDTGGAIKGAVRGDVYWGAGEHAEAIAGRMKNKGQYWLLIPKQK